MSDSFNTSLGTGSNYNLNLETLIQTNVSTTPQGPAKIQDTAAVSAPNESKYVFSPSNQPQIPPPTDKFDPDGALQLEDMIKNYVGDVLTSATKLPDVYKAFIDDTEAQLGNLTPEDIANMKTGLPPDQVIKMIRMAVFNADADVPQSIKEAATEIREQSAKSTGQAPDAVIRLVNAQSAEFGYSILLKEEISKLGLSPEDQQKLLAADQMPEFAEKLSPGMQKMLATAQAKALSGVHKEVGVSANWKPASSSAGFKLGVANAFEKEIGDKLYDKFMGGNLSKAEYNDIRTMLYIPDAKPPNAEKLGSLLTDIETQAKSDVQKNWGFPDSYKPQIDSQDYTAILTGTFYAIAQKAIAAQTPPLSAADQTKLTAALSSPSLKEGLSPVLKEVLSSIETAASAKVVKQYGLPPTWTPDAQLLTNAPGLNTPKLQFGQSALAMGFELVNKLKELAGPQNASGSVLAAGTASSEGEASAIGAASANSTQSAKPSFTNKILNYLKVVSNALGALQEVLFAASITQTNISKMLSRIEQDATMGKLAVQKKNIEDTKAKLAKEASMGPFKWVIMIILVLLIVFTAGMLGAILGPLIAGMAVGMATNAVVEGAVKGNLNSIDMFQAMAETLGDLGAAMGSKALGQFMSAIVTALICIACPWALVFDLSVGGGSMVTVMLEGIGIPPEIAGYLAMVIQVIAMVAMMVLSAIFAPALIPAELGLMVATITESIATMVPKIVMIVIEAVMNFIEAVEGAVTKVLNSVLNVVKQIMKAVKDAIMKVFVNAEKATKEVEKVAEKVANIQAKVLKATEKLESLKNAEVKDPTAIEKATKELAKLERLERSATNELTKAQKVLSDIEESVAKLKELGKKVEVAAKAAAEATTKEEKDAAKVQLKAAKDELRGVEKEVIKKAENKSVEQIKEVMKKVTDLTEEKKIAVSKVAEAEKAVDEANELVRVVKLEKDLYKEADALTELAKAKSVLKEAQSTNEEVTEKLAEASKELEEINEAGMRPLEQMATAAETTNDVINNSIQINNNIIQAQLALMKGELDAYLADVETFIKIIQSLLAKFQQSLQDLMKAISDLGSVMHESWVKASQSMTTLAQAM